MSEPGKWSLEGDAPEPQKWEDAPAPDEDAEVDDNFTGTDPNGRAIGPNEDPTKEKAVKKTAGSKK